MKYTVYRLPLVEGGQVPPYAITIKDQKTPIVHIDHNGSVKKKTDESILNGFVQTQDSSDLAFLVREYCPENTELKNVQSMLHG